MRVSGDRTLLWAGFLLVHGWLTFLGVVAVPGAAFHDVDLYRYWMHLALEQGRWPVLDDPWVYPVGALVPMLLPALGGTVSTAGYALGWCALVTALDGLALAVLMSRGGSATATAPPGTSTGPTRSAGGWWWLGFLVLLGPVAMGRLDGVVAPVMVLALVLAARSPRTTAAVTALLTAGAWIKVAPGVLLLPLLAAARRPLREVVVPAAAVCATVVAVVAAAGGFERLMSFLTEQRGRGLQVEAVTATPWVVASVLGDDSEIVLNDVLITFEVTGPGTAAAAAALDLVLLVLVAAVGWVLLVAGRRGTAGAALLPGSLVLVLVLVVANKVGSPQLLAWLAAPVAVLLTTSVTTPARWLRVVGGLTLAAAALTQAVFPWGYMRLLTGDPWVTGLLAARNVLLVVLLVCAVAGLCRASGVRTPVPGQVTLGATS